MIRFIATTFTLTFIGVIILGLLFIFLVKFNYNSLFGKDLRTIVLQFPTFVQLLNLNQPGDNRKAYLSSKYPIITVNSYYLADSKPDSQMSSWIKDMISNTTGKTVTIETPRPLSFGNQAAFTDADLKQVGKSLAKPLISPASLKLVYLSTYAVKPSYLGITLTRDTIFIFKKQLSSLEETPSVTARLEQSTLMHEWGHLLGLEHVPFSGCIMSADVETMDVRQLKEIDVPLTHCKDTLYDLEKLKTTYR